MDFFPLVKKSKWKPISLVIFVGCLKISFVLILDDSNASKTKWWMVRVRWSLLFRYILSSTLVIDVLNAAKFQTQFNSKSANKMKTDQLLWWCFKCKIRCKKNSTKISNYLNERFKFVVFFFALRWTWICCIFYSVEGDWNKWSWCIVFRLGEAHRSKCALYDAKLPILVSKQPKPNETIYNSRVYIGLLLHIRAIRSFVCIGECDVLIKHSYIRYTIQRTKTKRNDEKEERKKNNNTQYNSQTNATDLSVCVCVRFYSTWTRCVIWTLTECWTNNTHWQRNTDVCVWIQGIRSTSPPTHWHNERRREKKTTTPNSRYNSRLLLLPYYRNNIEYRHYVQKQIQRNQNSW